MQKWTIRETMKDGRTNLADRRCFVGPFHFRRLSRYNGNVMHDPCKSLQGKLVVSALHYHENKKASGQNRFMLTVFRSTAELSRGSNDQTTYLVECPRVQGF